MSLYFIRLPLRYTADDRQTRDTANESGNPFSVGIQSDGVKTATAVVIQNTFRLSDWITDVARYEILKIRGSRYIIVILEIYTSLESPKSSTSGIIGNLK